MFKAVVMVGLLSVVSGHAIIGKLIGGVADAIGKQALTGIGSTDQTGSAVANGSHHLGLPGVAELDLTKGDDGMGIGFETILNHGVRGRVDEDGVGVNIGRTGHHTIDAEIGQKGATIGLEGHGLEMKSHIGYDGATVALGPKDSPIEAHIGLLDGASIGIGDHKLTMPSVLNLFG